MSEIIGLDKLPESINQEAKKKLLKVIGRLAKACRVRRLVLLTW